jgi:hypothetical protein
LKSSNTAPSPICFYRRRRFDAEIIEVCVRWYITYRLTTADPAISML